MRINTKCSVAVHCLLFLHEYGETQRVTSGILALSTGCNPVVIRMIDPSCVHKQNSTEKSRCKY